LDCDDLKREDAKSLAKYNERFRPLPYRKVFFQSKGKGWKIDASYTDSYFNSATFLLKGIAAGELLDGMYGVAAVFLCRHYLELQLKYTLFHSRWLTAEDKNAVDSEIEDVEKGHPLQPYWTKLTAELKAKVPSALAVGLDLKFVGELVAEFDKVDDKYATRFRYPSDRIGVVPAAEQSRSALGIDYKALLFDLNRAHDVLGTLDGRLVNQYGENESWEDELNSA